MPILVKIAISVADILADPIIATALVFGVITFFHCETSALDFTDFFSFS